MKYDRRIFVATLLLVPAFGCPGDDTAGASGGGQTEGIETISPSGGSTGVVTGTTVATADGSDADISITVTDPTATTGVTGTEDSSSTADPTTAGPTSSSSSGGETVCETVVCGPAEECCAMGEDCVNDACLPECDSGVRCGGDQTTCCDAGQVCVSDACVDPAGACVDSFDCEVGEFCEPTLDACLPQFDPVSCELVPEFDELTVLEEWSYTDQEVISIPVVADIDGDSVPEVVLNLTQIDGQSWPGGQIHVLDGQTGAEELTLPDNPGAGTFGSHGRSTIGLSDVSGDGLPDIIYAGRSIGGVSLIHAVDFTGTLLWTSHDGAGADVTFSVENGGPSFANFDADPEAEIVFGATLIDNDGLVVWDAGNGATFGTNANYPGGISALVDLDADAYPEIVSGRHAWQVDWQEVGGMPTAVTVTQFWDAGAPDGYPAIADMDLDGDPEVVLVADSTVRVLNGATGELWCGIDPTDALCVATPALRTAAVPIPSGGRGGPPTVSDFDGDGRPEIAAAGSGSYTVYDLFRAGEDTSVFVGAAPSLGEIYPRWSQTTRDQSSNTTGSSVFDFQGDGAAEVVYADECYMRVYDGRDGSVLLQIESSSATIHEYPLVVDVDDDGNSEILVVANDSGADCGAIPGYTERRGLYVYGDQFDRWVGTRRVWPSHTYHVTSATSSGHVPATELDNWTQPGLNNYRQNAQGLGVFNAPDLAVDLNAELGECTQNVLEVVATVRNQGTLGVPAGIDVSLYEGVDATGVLIGTQMTTEELLPGATTDITWQIPFNAGDPALSLYVSVDGVDAVSGVIAECEEENNDDATLDAECLFPG